MLLIHQLLEQPSLLAYFIGADNYAWLQFRSGERRLLAKPLVYFEKRLPTFIRIHKTALINPTCIATVKQPPRPKMAGSVRLVDGTELPVSRRRWKEVIQLLQSQGNAIDSVKSSVSTRSNLAQEQVTPLLVQVIMKGDTLLLAEQCLRQLDVPFTLQSSIAGAELASALLLRPTGKWPKLIIIDSRMNRADSIVTVQTLKGHGRLRAIPVIYLIPPSENMMQAYQLDANSVVVVPDDPSSLVRILNKIVDYWLKIVQLVD
ncbi:LytTR family transcriptional regulator DNA-binding domain-containing protein [Spirosoma sp. BT702]|uniref:LytTR family transcriptional regulator DNA-binding domain-containing protein n=1 Tax=Spirosoma profusum TaxID=2771354 RepID=A0A927AVC9_9BACT|nr:LytTR family transcriptional regulator DNA-binding domain-containing protein [Spirosoma profusum]MBD2705086.1 LytTR family transcriptional regulator DNA-binding domain-containing protein [Spirosoma profusum]